ncbi:hypothetical protein, partial [Pseudomonas sp. PS02286]
MKMLLFAFFVVVAMMQNDKTTGLPRPVCAIHCGLSIRLCSAAFASKLAPTGYVNVTNPMWE